MILSIFLPTLLGWLLGLAVIKYLKSGRWLKNIDFTTLAAAIENELLSPEFLKEKLLSPENYQKLVPQVELHIDHFLRVRLKEDMPVVGMMIGDRTINQMKGIFHKELEQLFPEVMEGFLKNLKTDHNIAHLLAENLMRDNFFLGQQFIEPFVKANCGCIPLYIALAGFASGMLQVLIYFLSRA